MKVAVIGSGVSGLVAARLLRERAHDVTVFEAAPRAGGHAHAVEVPVDGRPVPVDIGFMVFNPESYPVLSGMFDEMGVASRPTDMSFSVSCERTGIEYSGRSLGAFFAQRRNLVRPGFWRMGLDILRFFRNAPALLADEGSGPSLAEYLDRHAYSREFVELHILPLASAIWSARPEALLDMPARFLVAFFQRQGFLQATGRATWRTVVGSSRSYVGAIAADLGPDLRLACPVRSVRRLAGGVEIRHEQGGPERFDHVFLAVHSDQALRLLADPTPDERDVLGAIPYQPNTLVLHDDEGVLPRNHRARASWNYHVGRADGLATMTYDLSRLQGLPAGRRVLAALNGSERVRPDRILGEFMFHHPVFTAAAVAAQARHADISGAGRTHYCGAYWRWGFHEDGARSAVEACDLFLARHEGQRAVAGDAA